MKGKPPYSATGTGSPITEADLHAFVDGQLAESRRHEVQAFLDSHPEALERVAGWQHQNSQLRSFFQPVLEEPLPLRLPLQRERQSFPWANIAAGVMIAVTSAGAAWYARGASDVHTLHMAAAYAGQLAAGSGDPQGFVHRAVVAHAVYTPDAKRPVEMGADQEQALATWLTKRLGEAVHPPTLGNIGYNLVGGRLLPGGKGPVAQFMYTSASGQRLTLYVTREAAGEKTAFRFTQDGPVKVFYWVDEHFGYALSGAIERDELLRVSQEVYKQLG